VLIRPPGVRASRHSRIRLSEDAHHPAIHTHAPLRPSPGRPATTPLTDRCGFEMPIRPTCPGDGHAGTEADPCPVSYPYCGQSNWFTDPDFKIVAGGDTLGNGGWALHIRVAEMMSGSIPHALYLLTGFAHWGSCGGSSCPAGRSGAWAVRRS
jgi:hypothetical protein